MIVGHVMVVLGTVLLAAYGGRVAARRLGQPPVVGEIAGGLLLGLALWAAPGPVARDVVLPGQVLDLVHMVGQAGLVLFIVGVAHDLRLDGRALRDRAVGWVTLGTLVPSAVAGALFGGVVLWTGRPEMRGDAPAAAFVLLMTIALAVSAVPVLARILVDRGLSTTRTGRLAITAAVVVDAVAWLSLAAVAGVVKGGAGGVVVAAGVVVAGVTAALLIRRLLTAPRVLAICAPVPGGVATAIAVCALGAAAAAESWGLTAVFGAFVVGLAIPAESAGARWAAPAGMVSKVGTWLMPVFLVHTGLAMWTASASVPLSAVLITALAATVLGVLTPALYLALVLMGLTTTAMTGPVLSLTDRLRRVPVSAIQVSVSERSASW